MTYEVGRLPARDEVGIDQEQDADAVRFFADPIAMWRAVDDQRSPFRDQWSDTYSAFSSLSRSLMPKLTGCEPGNLDDKRTGSIYNIAAVQERAR